MRHHNHNDEMQQSPLRGALKECKTSFLWTGFFSLFINLLLLVPAIYMLQVYDRVLASGSGSTLLMLTIIVIFLFVVLGFLEWVRTRIVIVASNKLDRSLSRKVFDALFGRALATGGKTATAQPLNDLLTLRQFLTGPGLFAFFDAPWLPLYVAIMFLFHFYFGVTALVAALVLLGLAVWNEMATREDIAFANTNSLQATHFTERNLRNVEAIEAMGMLPYMRERWHQKQSAVLSLQGFASQKAGFITMFSKTFRLTVQSLILGLGAYLAIHKEISPGAVIAGSILLGRALAPLDQMIGSWRGFLAAREAFRRLDELLVTVAPAARAMALPAPAGELALEKLVVTPPGAENPIIKGISLLFEAGTQVAIIGPSAAGKSTLARAILGLYPPTHGCVRLDGAEIDQWDREQLGQYIGYLPQSVELLDGSISDNIGRFGALDPEKVVDAAKAAGVHEMILRLPDGYQTKILGGGKILSAGQQQRVALARALYGDPKLILLDEPNSNLDQDGDDALVTALAELKRRGRTVIVITHRSNILSQVDRIVMLVDGQVALHGARDEVLTVLQNRLSKTAAALAAARGGTPVAAAGGGMRSVPSV
jgi:ATP-binding cassette subfamily C protein EexD